MLAIIERASDDAPPLPEHGSGALARKPTMSDLSLPLQQAASQLPVPFYFDEALLAREKNRLFDAGPRYVGHALAVPRPGDYFTLPQEKGGRALVRNAHDVERRKAFYSSSKRSYKVISNWNSVTTSM